MVRGEFHVPDSFPALMANRHINIDEVVNCALNQPAGPKLMRAYGEERFPRIIGYYLTPVIELFAEHELDGNFTVFPGDSRASFKIPTFCKSRDLRHPGNSILLPLKRELHFGAIRDLNKWDIPFGEKEDRLVWRGSTTGNFKMNSPLQPPSSRAFIPDVSPNLKTLDIDIGYSALTENISDSNLKTSEFEPFLKDRMSMRDQLQAKYLLCLEGNDVATSLKWMLASNSVVIMPHPTVESWACESFLRPFTHYVPVKADLSDLEEVFEWCREHHEHCRRIAESGKAFMDAFSDRAVEKKLQRRVATGYAEKVTLRR